MVIKSGIHPNMRISCEIDIVNRNLATFNVRQRKNTIRSQLSIGRKPGRGNTQADGDKNSNVCPFFFLVCSALDRDGTKFLINRNVTQVFTKFIEDGKATIRLHDPPKDLCISKADVLQLKSFLSILKQALEGNQISDVVLSTLAPASSKAFDKPKTNVVISSRKEYPVCTNFPSMCEKLQVSNCGMKKIDGRILKLKKLLCLNLSINMLTDLPDSLGDLQKLSEVILCDNQFTLFPMALCCSSLKDTVMVLDISGNKISALPATIALLHNLVSLKLDRNSVTSLPITIGKLSKLKHLTASRNKLCLLPGSALKLRLENIDLFRNDFPSPGSAAPTGSDKGLELGVPSLMETVARFVKKHGLAYNPDVIYAHLCSYLDSARTCWCGDPCFLSSTRRVQWINLDKIATSVTAVDQMGTKTVPFEIFLCSAKCVTKFNKNPRAYWR